MHQNSNNAQDWKDQEGHPAEEEHVGTNGNRPQLDPPTAVGLVDEEYQKGENDRQQDVHEQGHQNDRSEVRLCRKADDQLEQKTDTTGKESARTNPKKMQRDRQQSPTSDESVGSVIL